MFGKILTVRHMLMVGRSRKIIRRKAKVKLEVKAKSILEAAILE